MPPGKWMPGSPAPYAYEVGSNSGLCANNNGPACAAEIDLVSTVLASLYPIVTAVLAAVVFRERLRAVQYAGVACAMVGVVLIALLAESPIGVRVSGDEARCHSAAGRSVIAIELMQ